MLLSRTLTKKKGSSNNIENPFLVSYRFLYDETQKICKLFFRCNPLLQFVLCFCISSPTKCDRQQNCSIFILKNPWNFSSTSSRSRYKWLNISKTGLFMFIGCTHMFHLFRRHLHIIVCKTRMLKFSVALEFFTRALFKEYQKPTGTRGDLIGLDSVGVNTP